LPGTYQRQAQIKSRLRNKKHDSEKPGAAPKAMGEIIEGEFLPTGPPSKKP